MVRVGLIASRKVIQQIGGFLAEQRSDIALRARTSRLRLASQLRDELNRITDLSVRHLFQLRAIHNLNQPVQG